ncbi:uncharacterized protein PV09_08497 [Verruconis gallopava]|uniref:SPIN90/Ldb17 leucine-rich domain-containing protein n=1 Tax=Verruconis gallopava TaxID=253628 RepID=A0A0D1ZZG4_9PEZI|nr:uncharacterized protein PV09_08497 [Verruconis gallopava]KIV99827.1 hypothetical protein PV09_08497 [Verruconis gallopava]
MDFEVSYDLETADQFWDELEDIVSSSCSTHEAIDNSLRSYLAFTTKFRSEFLQDEYDIAKCSYKLLDSPIFTAHTEYVRRQCVYALLQEDEPAALHLLAAILLCDGRANEETLFMLQQEGAFPRLVELVTEYNGREGEEQLHRMLLDIMYEMSRIQRLTWEDLSAVNDGFVISLFAITESLSSDASDPYHYPVIRVLLVLNEQYMVLSASATADMPPITNRVLKALSVYSSRYKTFGENLILLLNRESETSLQLLILKLLYLVFNTKSTAEYFYTNDLHVLTDVILRNLLDLPAENEAMQALRHTYLRVLHPLLANSQLSKAGMSYKPREILTVLRILEGNTGNSLHFAPSDPTTVRLVQRCRSVPWLQEAYEKMVGNGEMSPLPDDENERGSPASRRGVDPARKEGDGAKEVANKLLGMTLSQGGDSALSVAAVAEHMEKPGVITPSKGYGNGPARP